MPGTNTCSTENPVISSPTPDKKNRSFSSQKLAVLRPVTFKSPLPACPTTTIFLHPPKAGGTTLLFVAQAWSKVYPDFKVYRFAVPRLEGCSPNRISGNWRGGLESAETALKSNPNLCDGINVISGHFPFGLHAYIKSCAPKQYITLIRHPIERELSSTNFDLQRGYVDKENAETYLLSGKDNPQTRLLAGEEFMAGPCNEKTLAQAKSNIDKHFFLAGVTEDTDSFISILASMQNWGPIAVCRAQVTGEKIFKDISEDLKKQLMNIHQFDIELYTWVKERWYAWKEKNVKAFQDSNLWPSEKILCIKSDFATTRIPEWLSLKEIEAYNQTVPDTLIEIVQNHTGIKEINFSKEELVKTEEILSTLLPCEASAQENKPVTLILDYLRHSETASQHKKLPEDEASEPSRKREAALL
jgi:hypothetical protein